MCDCGCGGCSPKKPVLINENLAPKEILSEGLKYHMDNARPLTEHVYRAGSQKYFELWAEARALYTRGILEVQGDDLQVLTETDLGHFGIVEGQKVPLDFPIELTEAEKLTYNDFVRMVRDDMMAGSSPDDHISDDQVKKRAKSYYNEYLKGTSVDDLFEAKERSKFILVTMDAMGGSIEAESKEEFIEKMKQAGYDHTGDLSAETDPYKDHPTMDKSQTYGLPRFKQVHGPMDNGGQVRYETLDAYDLYSLEEGLSDDERAKIYFLQQFKQGNIDKLPQDPKVAYLQKLTQDQIDHDKETYRKEIEEGMGGQLDEPYFIEVSVRDARKALDIYKDQFREEDVEMYGSNVYASTDPEVIYDLMMSFEAQEIEVHDYEAGEEMLETFFSSQNKDKEEEEPKDFVDTYTKQMSYWNEDNHPGRGKRRDTPEEREGSRQAGMQMTQQTHKDKSKYTRKEKHKQSFNENSVPSQEEVDQFFEKQTHLQTHYLNSKPVDGQKGSFNKTEVAPWDEVDSNNWRTLLSKSLDEGVSKTKEALDKVTTIMKDLAKKYKAGDKSVVDQLKTLTITKKKLEVMLDKEVAGTSKDQELD